jgi:hypothetical protein
MPSILNATTSSGLVTSADNSGSLQLATNNGTTAVTIDTSQNVGIGSTSPNARLRIKKDGASDYSNISIDNANSTASISFGVGGSSAGVTALRNHAFLINQGNSSLLFGTNDAERMRIVSGGNVLIGKATTDVGTVGTRMDADGALFCSIVTGNDSLYVYSTTASAYRHYVSAAGTIFATNTTISAISDQRLKENITDLDVGLEKIMALKPRKFDWKENKGKDIKGDRGFIAQEFEQVFPDLVDEWKDPSPEGEEPYKSVRADLIPVLVKAIQELNAKVDAQALEIQALKSLPTDK